MMPRPKAKVARVSAVKVHLKFLGITDKTRANYKTAVSRFFSYVKHCLERPPQTPQELRHAAAEFVNFLYQDDRPLYWAGDFLSGFKRFHPSQKLMLDEASGYYKNWSNSVVRSKALPFPVEFVQVMAAVAVTEGNFELATLCLLAFAGLFRLGELFNLRLRMIDVVSDNFCIITLLSSKTTGPVAISIKDATIISILKARVAKGRPTELLYAGSYRCISIFLRRVAFLLEIDGERFTGHGFRRGGATHLFRLVGNYDRVQSAGRWGCAKTCRSYVDEALADRALLSLTEGGRRFLQQGVSKYPEIVAKLLK